MPGLSLFGSSLMRPIALFSIAARSKEKLRPPEIPKGKGSFSLDVFGRLVWLVLAFIFGGELAVFFPWAF
jgi:hypothetical protein